MNTVLLILLILLPLALLGGIIALILYLGKKRVEKEKLKRPTDILDEMRKSARGWGILLILLNGALVLLLPANSPMKASAVGSLIPVLIMGGLFLRVRDSVMFLAYGILLMLWGLQEALMAGGLGLAILIGRVVVGITLIRSYRRYRTAQVAYYEEQGVSFEAARKGMGTNATLSQTILFTGAPSGIGVAILFIYGLIVGFVGESAMPSWVITLDALFSSMALMVTSLTIAVWIEKLYPSDLAVASGLTGILAALALMLILGFTLVLRIMNGETVQLGMLPQPTPTNGFRYPPPLPTRAPTSTRSPTATQPVTTPTATETYLPPASFPNDSLVPAGLTLQLIGSPREVSNRAVIDTNSYALDGDMLVVVARTDRPYAVFYRRTDAGVWQYDSHVQLMRSSPNHLMGMPLALEGDILAVGDDQRVMIFERSGTEWQQTIQFLAPAQQVFMSGTSIMTIGSTADYGTLAARFFQRQEDGTWVEDRGGVDLTSDGQDRYMVGAFDGDVAALRVFHKTIPSENVIHILSRVDDKWTETGVLASPDLAMGGGDIVIENEVLVIGSGYDGREVTFIRDITPEVINWDANQVTYLDVPNSAPPDFDSFTAIDINSGRLAVGRTFYSENLPLNAVYVYAFDPSTLAGALLSTIQTDLQFYSFGYEVVLSQSSLIVGHGYARGSGLEPALMVYQLP